MCVCVCVCVRACAYVCVCVSRSLLVISVCRLVLQMEQIKKKLAALKEEKDVALEKADEAESRAKDAEARAEAVCYVSYMCITLSFLFFSDQIAYLFHLLTICSIFPMYIYFNMCIHCIYRLDCPVYSSCVLLSLRLILLFVHPPPSPRRNLRCRPKKGK